MKELILRIYKVHHSGKENAITRIKFIIEHGWTLPDDFLCKPVDVIEREFRQIYSQLPICTCDKGGFYPTRKEEILEYRDYLRKKAIPLFERFRRVCDAHPDLANDMGQLDLFNELEWSDDEGRTNQVTHDE